MLPKGERISLNSGYITQQAGDTDRKGEGKAGQHAMGFIPPQGVHVVHQSPASPATLQEATALQSYYHTESPGSEASRSWKNSNWILSLWHVGRHGWIIQSSVMFLCQSNKSLLKI